MKYIMLFLLMLVIGSSSYAQIKLPDLSPRATISQRVGLVDIEIAYSRPSLRERELFGLNGILDEGQFWRTGANSVTKFTISQDILLNNSSLKEGTYAILTVPTHDNCTFHFYPYEAKSWNAFKDDISILQIPTPMKTKLESTESLHIFFDDLGLDEATLNLSWGRYTSQLKIKTNDHESVLKNIDKTLEGPSSFQYFQAALYMHETSTDLPKALKYIRKVTKSESALFFQVYREAVILEDLKRYEEARQAVIRTRELAEKSNNLDFVRLCDQMIDRMRGLK